MAWETVACGAAAAIAGLACAWRGFLVEPWRIGVDRIALALPRVPRALESARVLFVSDLHTGGWGWREVFIADHLRRRPPDLMLVTGDLVSGPAGLPVALALLGRARPRLGVFYVRGNNEVEELPDAAALEGELARLGWVVLMNRHRLVEAGGGERFAVAGVDDPNNRLDRLDEALAGIPPATFTILLSHTPETFPQAARAGVELVVSGHTHGGQVRLPWFGPLWSDTPRTGLRYTAGLYREGGGTLLVSRGIGWSLLPLRFLCTPQVIELELRRYCAE
jgi:predicted MPP superfamily phosphohydrolase